MKLKRIAACAALLLMLALPVRAESGRGEANITAQMTLKEIRANPSLQASGYNLYTRGDNWSPLSERKWENATLGEYANEYSAEEAAKGLNLLIENYNSGVQVTHQVYTQEEIAADSSLGMVQLTYFPSDSGEKKYALVVPGNMTMRSGGTNEGVPTAWVLHEMGYTVFVLRYRIFTDAAESAPLTDLRRAVQYITENADALNVQPEDYALIGYSSGGQISGLFVSDEGDCKKYGLPMPAVLILGYPVNDFFEAKLLYTFMIDGGSFGDHYYMKNVSDAVTENFPPTYHWVGEDDTMLKRITLSNQSPKLELALQRCGVEHVYRVYKHAPHSIGPGTGTDAAGWLNEAVAFWEAHAGE